MGRSYYFGEHPPNTHLLECDKHGKMLIKDYDAKGQRNTEVGCPHCNRERQAEDKEKK